jgi:hypothetical protein
MPSLIESVAEVVLTIPRWIEDQVTADSLQNAREAIADSRIRRAGFDEARVTGDLPVKRSA